MSSSNLGLLALILLCQSNLYAMTPSIEIAIRKGCPFVMDFVRDEYDLWLELANKPKLFQGREEITQKMLTMIDKTKEELVLTTFHCDPYSVPVLRIVSRMREKEIRLKERLKKNTRDELEREGYRFPIKIHFISDEFTGLAKLHDQHPAVQGQSNCFNELKSLSLDPYLFQFEFSTFRHGGFGCTHSKYMVRDRVESYVQSMNLSDENLFEVGMSQKSHPVAKDLLEDFREMSQVSVTQFSNLPEGERVNFSFDRLSQVSIRPFERQVFSKVIRKKESVLPVIRDVKNPQSALFLQVFENARFSNIDIMTPNLNFNGYREQIMKAVRNGNHVRIILSYKFEEKNQSKPFQGGTNSQVMETLLNSYRDYLDSVGESSKGGKLEMGWFSQHPDVVPLPEYSSHAKYFRVGPILMIGSTNMDCQSWYGSREQNILIEDESTVQEFSALLFEQQFKQAFKCSHTDIPGCLNPPQGS